MWKLNNLKYIFQAIYNNEKLETYFIYPGNCDSGVHNIAGKYLQPSSPLIGIFKVVTYIFKVSSYPSLKCVI